MAIASRRRDPEAVRRGLGRWLRAHRPGASDVRVAPLTRPAAGLSSETLFVDAAWTEDGAERREAMVARLPPPGDGLFPAYDLGVQARLQQRLAEITAIPVARPLAFEADETWVGSEFLLMPRIPGRAPATNPPYVSEGWLHDADRADQARLHEAFLAVVADIHRLDWQGLGLAFAGRDRRPGLDGELAWWEWYLDWAADGAPLPVLADATAWCRAHRPEPEPPASLLWGDVQLANTLFDDDLAPTAILDWELASIGPAEMDLGWFLALHEIMAEMHGDLPGFPGRHATVAAYERRLGRSAVSVDWFVAFALVRSGAIMMRIAALLASVGVDKSWLTRGNPQIDRLATLIR